MINILLVEEDKNYSINILNCINLKNTNVKISAIVTNIKDILPILTQNNIDIILVDINKSNYKDFIMIDYNCNHLMILLVENNFITEELTNNACVLGIIQKSDDFNNINYQINNLIVEKQSNDMVLTEMSTEHLIKRKIINELNYLGYDFLHKGSKYLIECIYLIYTLDINYEYNLEKDIYPKVAKKYNQTWNNIKSAIRYATDIMYYNNEESKLKEYLQNYNFSKFGVSVVILVILEKIRN